MLQSNVEAIGQQTHQPATFRYWVTPSRDSTATLNASGTTGGGSILVGAITKARMRQYRNAYTTSIAQGATLQGGCHVERQRRQDPSLVG